MLDPRKNVLRNGGLLSESLLKSLISAAVCKVQAARSLTDKDLADMIGCDPGTIAHARNRESKLQAHTLFNLLAVDDYALEGFLQHFGRRSVPVEARCDTDELVTTAGAVHKLAAVKSPDSPGGAHITDTECLEIERDLDAALASLQALKTRCITIRTERAA